MSFTDRERIPRNRWVGQGAPGATRPSRPREFLDSSADLATGVSHLFCRTVPEEALAALVGGLYPPRGYQGGAWPSLMVWGARGPGSG